MAIAVQALLSSCEKEDTLVSEESPALPTELKINTLPVDIKTEIGAIAHATVYFGEEVLLIEPSFCISTSHNPTLGENDKHAVITFEKNPGDKSIFYSGDSINFKTAINKLNPSTNYFIRAYIKTPEGIVYGNEETFKTKKTSEINYAGYVNDADGNIYETVIIGEQQWITQNLRSTKFSNGDDINEIKDSLGWIETKDPAFCSPISETLSESMSGKIYNKLALKDSRNICPTDWHAANHDDWEKLSNYLSEQGFDGNETLILNSCNYDGYEATNGINYYGFNNTTGRARYGELKFNDIEFCNNQGFFWALDSESTLNQYYIFNENNKLKNHIGTNILSPSGNVRCVK